MEFELRGGNNGCTINFRDVRHLNPTLLSLDSDSNRDSKALFLHKTFVFPGVVCLVVANSRCLCSVIRPTNQKKAPTYNKQAYSDAFAFLLSFNSQ